MYDLHLGVCMYALAKGGVVVSCHHCHRFCSSYSRVSAYKVIDIMRSYNLRHTDIFQTNLISSETQGCPDMEM